MRSDRQDSERVPPEDHADVFGVAWLSVREARKALEGENSAARTNPVDDALFVWRALPEDAEAAAERFVVAQFEATVGKFESLVESARRAVAAARSNRAERLKVLERKAQTEQDAAAAEKVEDFQKKFELEYVKLDEAVTYAEGEVVVTRRRLARHVVHRRLILSLARAGLVVAAIMTELLPLSEEPLVKLGAALAIYIILDWLLVGKQIEPRLLRWNRRRAEADLRPALHGMERATGIARRVNEIASREVRR